MESIASLALRVEGKIAAPREKHTRVRIIRGGMGCLPSLPRAIPSLWKGDPTSRWKMSRIARGAVRENPGNQKYSRSNKISKRILS
jgi:hypothetical protein